ADTLDGHARAHVRDGVGGFAADGVIGAGEGRLIELYLAGAVIRVRADIADTEEIASPESVLHVQVVFLGTPVEHVRVRALDEGRRFGGAGREDRITGFWLDERHKRALERRSAVRGSTHELQGCEGRLVHGLSREGGGVAVEIDSVTSAQNEERMLRDLPGEAEAG